MYTYPLTPRSVSCQRNASRVSRMSFQSPLQFVFPDTFSPELNRAWFRLVCYDSGNSIGRTNWVPDHQGVFREECSYMYCFTSSRVRTGVALNLDETVVTEIDESNYGIDTACFLVCPPRCVLPNITRHYSKNSLSCTYVFTATTPGSSIRLRFLHTRAE